MNPVRPSRSSTELSGLHSIALVKLAQYVTDTGSETSGLYEDTTHTADMIQTA
jgi:hypothetical protein